ncbi:MAG: EAL domain-containing response regulator [Gammaproteobacteria bacterium]|nr:EAL domain-containing response regulator [Gammaproteobacteria bacterium]
MAGAEELQNCQLGTALGRAFQGSASRILLLDDEPFELKLLARSLASLGLDRIETYESGIAALSALQDHGASIELVFLDLNMPQLDGIEFVRQLVGIGYSGSLVFVSGEDNRVREASSNLARGYRLSVLGHLAKPVQPQALFDLLNRWQPIAPSAGAQARKIYAAGEIRNAIACNELANYYQPKVNLDDGALMGVETLVRWHHPEDGLVLPGQFVGVAEEHGFVEELTRVVLSESIAQAKRWRDTGIPLRVAVNVSMDDLVQLEFADFVLKLLAHHAVPTEDLIIEVTESRLMKNILAPLDTLTRLRIKHISLAIDDFGTGQSSLAKLRDMPFNILKIDRTFVHGACNSPTLDAFVLANLSIAKQLGMVTVAEGVEDRADWEYLRGHGCDVAQGYFIAKPMPSEQIPDWLTSWEARREELELV